MDLIIGLAFFLLGANIAILVWQCVDITRLNKEIKKYKAINSGESDERPDKDSIELIPLFERDA